MKRLAYIATLSAMVVLMFTVIASAQDSPEQTNSSDPNSADQAQGSAPSEQAAPAQDAPTVSIHANAFDPPELSVAPGTTVTFFNEDTVPHTVDLEGLFDSTEISPGYTYPVTLSGSGTVTYSDEENPDMQGTIIVGGAS